jgi:malate dehydrogenase
MARAKVGIIGAGNVGASLAFSIINRDIADVVISDIVEGLPQGKALDMSESRTPDLHDSGAVGTNKVEDMNGCDVVVVTAGVPRKPGMTREQLLDINAKILRDVCGVLKTFKPQPIVIVVTNPLDVMTYLAYKLLGFPKSRVIGMAGVLDSSRMCHFIAEKLGVSAKDVHAMVLGSHGDTMVPVPRLTSVSGIPLPELLPAEEIEKINQRTKDGGAEIVALLKTGSAFYAPGSSIAVMVESILKDERRLLPCSVVLEGEYGQKDVVLGVPIIVGRNGVEKIVSIKLTESENAALNKSADVVRDNIKILKV